MDIFDTPLHRWLLEEQTRILGLISTLNAKNRRKIENERKALEVLRKGRGRLKNPRPISLDDQARLIQYQAELKVVDIVEDVAAMSTPEAFKRRLLAVANDLKSRYPENSEAVDAIPKRAEGDEEPPPTRRGTRGRHPVAAGTVLA
jgi:hypothetical protein